MEVTFGTENNILAMSLLFSNLAIFFLIKKKDEQKRWEV